MTHYYTTSTHFYGHTYLIEGRAGRPICRCDWVPIREKAAIRTWKDVDCKECLQSKPGPKRK